MKIVAHISDLHFGRIDPAVVEGLHAALRACRPDLVVVSGDLTQRARTRQFLAARDFLDRLALPYLVVPGNHDIPAYDLLARFTRPLGRYRRYIVDQLYPIHCDDEIAAFGLNTARPLVAHWNWAHGSLSHGQLARAGVVLGSLPAGLFKIVVTHHPFLPPPDAPRTRLVGRAGRALEVFKQHGVDLLLAGHLHRSYSGDVASHHAMIEHSILVIQAATATSTRLRNEPNAFNLLTIDGGRLGLTVWGWTGTAFAPGASETFVKSAGRWMAERIAA